MVRNYRLQPWRPADLSVRSASALREEMWSCRGQVRYLLVLISGDSGEHGLREGEGARALPGRHGSHWGQLLSALLADDVHARLVLVHGVQNDLKN